MEGVDNFSSICKYINEAVGYDLARCKGTTLTFEKPRDETMYLVVHTQGEYPSDFKADTIYDQVVIQNIMNMIRNEEDAELWTS